MSTTRSMKITFQGETRDVTVPMPASLAGLQEAISSTFSADLPPRSKKGAADGDLRFTHSDAEGNAIVFDKESELNLALRLCPMLEISAAPKADIKEASNTSQEADDPNRIYNVATRNLRQNHGVPHMTSVKLMKTLTLLKLGPRRLVVQGLAPRKLLAPAMKNQRLSPGGKGANDQDLADSACTEIEEMTLEDEEKEDNSAETAEGKSPPSSPSSKMPIRDALLAADVRLPPGEIKPLLSALGVPPRRLVKLGLVDAKDLRNGPGMRASRGRGPGGRNRRGCGPRADPAGPQHASSGRGPGNGNRRGCGPRADPAGPQSCRRACRQGRPQNGAAAPPHVTTDQQG